MAQEPAPRISPAQFAEQVEGIRRESGAIKSGLNAMRGQIADEQTKTFFLREGQGRYGSLRGRASKNVGRNPEFLQAHLDMMNRISTDPDTAHINL